MATIQLLRGIRAVIFKYIRSNGRCPYDAFMKTAAKNMKKKKFEGQFAAVLQMGTDYRNPERFKPLQGPGKPLWEFKEHDHRLYTIREVYEGTKVRLILLNGWVKDKEGPTAEEDREIERAKSFEAEHLLENTQRQAVTKGGK